ncbi:hypothetical protein DN404_30200 [Bacillus sp. TE8-1]|nr:hypothetical protein DN404_30200 [Bacillus sp. TE8-1]
MTQNNPLFKTGYFNEVNKEFEETGPKKPMKFLVIIMYAKESIRSMKFKQNSYLIKKPCTKKCTRLYKNYVLRAHFILCL